jgi:EAL domain-containing protein (putative c-di-GMP-specific phosphodiesterase class I)/CheY-like chemotaxis protein
MENNSDLIILDDEESEPAHPVPAWRVLIVDDDDDVHTATDFAIRGAVILGRPVETVHARSVSEALTVSEEVSDIAVAFIDVVMETPDAGLRLVRALREAGRRDMRIVLRTGYPGYAPEMSVITDYEIDDYRTKEELTRTRLLSVLTASIRGYDQISAITRGRCGLEMIIESSTQLFQRTNLEMFSQGVLVQVGALLRVEPSGFVCVHGLERARKTNSCIVSAIGEFAALIGKPLSEVGADINALVDVARGQTEPLFRDGYMVMQFTSETGRELCAVLEAHPNLEVADLSLLRLFCTNISIGFENLALVEELDRLAFNDVVLDVPNLNAFEIELGKAIADGKDDKRIVLLAIASFQSIVAAYGTHVANRLLLEIHNRLADHAGGAMIAIVGEATFGLIADRDTVGPDFMATLFVEPYRIDDVELVPHVTSAIVELDELPDDPAAALRIATTALVHVRQAHEGESVVYGAIMQREVERKRLLQVALKETIGDGADLEVHLQPQVDLSNGAVVGAEALLRWTREGEAISPAEFIPIAEASGLTEALTDFVFERVAAWSHAHAGPLPVAVNLSMADLNRPGFATWVMGRLKALDLTPERIEFEVTEGIAMRDAPRAVRQVSQLNRAGYRIALDDFGTGYSSLGHFSQLPIDTLKIDRSFVNLLDKETASSSLAAIVLLMTNALKVDCVAEGIETEDQKEALILLGCRIGQGFLLGRPTPIDRFNQTFGLHHRT